MLSKLQSFANDITKLRQTIPELGRKINKVDISKFELTNSTAVQSELLRLENDVVALIQILESMMSGGISRYTTARERRNTYSWGRYGQLKGDANILIADLDVLLRHIDFLRNNAAEGKKAVVMMSALSELPDLDGDAKQADTVLGCIIIIAAIVSRLRRML